MGRAGKSHPHVNVSAAAVLRDYADRWVRLEDEKAEIAAQIKDLRAEAKSRGFDTKALAHIVRERRENSDQRDKRLEVEALTDIYRAALGMLDGTPLGEAARKRLSSPDEDSAPEEDSASPDAPEMAETAIGPEQIAEARDAGREGFRQGRRVIDNPFVAGDPRRAAWDEGWCLEAGSDGMDLPETWRRKAPKKPDGDGVAP